MTRPKGMIACLCHLEFSAAAEDFKNNPSADAWVRLERAMWAHQGAKMMSDEQLAPLDQTPLCDVIQAVADLQQGRDA